MNNSRKSDASTGQVFTILDAVKSNNEDEINELINDFDAEFIASKEIEPTDNQGNVSALTLEANLHIVDRGTTHTK